MKIFYKFLFTAVFIFSCAVLSAQKNDRPVRFANGNFVTGNNIEKQTFKKEDISAALSGDKYFVLVQFSSLPSAAAQQKLQQAGVELNNYLPEHTYLAAIKNTFDFSSARNFNIVSITAIPAFYKIHKKLNGYKPSFNKEEGQAIVVNYFKEAGKALVAEALKKAGAVIITEKFDAAGIILIQYNKALVDTLAALPFVSSLYLQPIKDQLLNYNSRAAHAVTGLNAPGGKNLNGKGVTIGVGDNADVSTHIDFAGRLINRNPNTPTNHGTHTTGTAAGAGIIDPKSRGMASKATIVSQSFSDIIVYAPSYITDYNMIATNNSYHSANAGCDGEQEYNGLSAYGDFQMRFFGQLQHVFASGNDGESTCSPYPPAFGTVKTGWQCAKNILTVGALNVGDYTIASYSGRGPTADGRIKPEITTDGYAVYSTNAYNTYGYNYGTSMACPGATGSLALMYERYRQIHAGADPKSALVKAVTCNTAEDLGNSGPDYTFGFGMLNARRAVEALDSNRYFISSIANAGSNTHNFTVPANTRRLKIMLYWNDPAAAGNAATSLVNDLDLVGIEPSLTLHRPMSLNAAPANVDNTATEAPDHVNNIEQVVIENPAAGIYSANVNGFNIPSGPQEYVVTYEIIKNGVTVEYPFGGETFVPGETETIRWNAYGNEANSFTIEFSSNNGVSWATIANNVAATERLYNWRVPSTVTGSALIRVSRNGSGLSGQSNFGFTIFGQPVVTAGKACEGAVQLTWTPVTGATSYVIYQLAGDSMQVIGNTVSFPYLVTGLDKNKTYWFGVAPKNGTVAGRRSISVPVIPNSGPCSLAAFNNDLKIDTIAEPLTARQFFSNAANATKPVKVSIKNTSAAIVTGPYDISFDYGDAVITETSNVPINPNASVTYTFTGTYPVVPSGFQYNFKAWVNKPGDTNHLNDTAYKTVKYINNDPVASLPITENFDGMAGVEFTSPEMAIGGNKYLDFNRSSARGRARTFVNSGFSLSGDNALTLDQAPASGSSTTDSAVFNYNLSLFTSKELRFDFYYKNHGQADAPGNKVWIRGSENDNWIQAYDLFANQADIGEWKKGILNINNLLANAVPAQTVSATFQIKLGQQGYNSANSPEPVIDMDDGYTFDNLMLSEAMNDVAVLDLNSPGKSGCGLSANNPIGIKIKNYHNAALSNVEVNYKINNGTAVTETIPSIAANQTLDYVFSQTADLSAYIDYSIDVWVKYAADNYTSNDSILKYTLHGSPVISSYPYMQGFENDNGNFYAYGSNNTWQWGAPSKPVINKAANGSKIWTTNLTGDYSDNEISYLATPCFDLTGLVNPVLSFSHIYQVEKDFDYTWVEYSVDGKIWNKLGNINEGTNWYDDAPHNNWNLSTNRWRVASIDIPVTNTVVRFRFVMSSDGGVTEEGIGIDDVRIYEKKEIADISDQSPAVSATVNGSNWIPFEQGSAVMAEINANGQDLGTVSVTPFINTSAVRNSNGQYYADRSYVIRSTNAPTGNTGIRLYFTDAEARALINATGCASCVETTDAYELGITKYREIFSEENGTIDDNFYDYQFILPANTPIIPHGNGYYAEFTVNSFSEFWLSKASIAPYFVCQGSNSVSFTASPSGSVYQWQLDAGSGYVNISNGPNYSGATTSTLQVNNVSTSFSGYKYRAIVNGANGTEFTLRFKNIWTGTSSTDWFNAANWICGIVPDQYTDVLIPSGLSRYPVLTSNTAVRSIRMLKNAPVIINPGVKLDLNGR